MAEETKSTLTEEEKIERKLKIRRLISNIFIVVACLSIIAFAVLAFMTKGNIDTQTTYDTQELRSKLKNIINLEIRYHNDHGEYAEIEYRYPSEEIENYNPNAAGDFMYEFDPETKIATGRERDYNSDVNGDEDGNDGLTLSIDWEPGVLEGSAGGNFFWPEEDLEYFEEKRAEASQ